LLFVYGLGNPGKEYKYTRHNCGYLVVDKLSLVFKKKFKKKKNFLFFRTNEITGVKPLVYMNETGKAVKNVVEYFKCSIKDILFVVDDFNIETGVLRYRVRGSSGGHRGLESIVNEFGTEDFPRLRIGIGPVPGGIDPSVFVLSVFEEREMEKMNLVFDKVMDLILSWKNKGLPKGNLTIRT